VSFTTLLGLLFIGLKLGGAIGWSWFWVLCPFWIGTACVLAWLAFILFLVIVGGLLGKN
jgi:hypothetical protein